MRESRLFDFVIWAGTLAFLIILASAVIIRERQAAGSPVELREGDSERLIRIEAKLDDLLKRTEAR